MTRKAPKQSTLKALFAKSGNQCAFPNCNHHLVNEKGQFVAHVCHIEANAPKGPRYNSEQTDEERRSHGNLMLLCHAHHVEIDNDGRHFTVEKLKAMREEHESAQTHVYRISYATLSKLATETAEFWNDVELLNTVKHMFPEEALRINAHGSFADILQNVIFLINDIEEVGEYFRESDDLLMEDLLKFCEKLGFATSKIKEVSYYENPFVNRNWEMLNLRFRNALMKMCVLTLQLEIKYLEEYLKMNGHDLVARDRFAAAKSEFRSIAQRCGLAD